MLNNFSPTDRQLKLAKVMESPALKELLKRMEEGFVVRSNHFWHELVTEYGMSTKAISIRQIRTLESAGLIEAQEFDDYIEYRITYTGTFEELVRHETRTS